MDTPTTLAADMLAAAAAAVAGTRGVVQTSAAELKGLWRANVLQSAPIQNAHAQYAITYNTGVDLRGGKITAEIGYDKSLPGGDLGNLLEYGSRNNPPHRDGGRAADQIQPELEAALLAMAGKLL